MGFAGGANRGDDCAEAGLGLSAGGQHLPEVRRPGWMNSKQDNAGFLQPAPALNGDLPEVLIECQEIRAAGLAGLPPLSA